MKLTFHLWSGEKFFAFSEVEETLFGVVSPYVWRFIHDCLQIGTEPAGCRSCPVELLKPASFHRFFSILRALKLVYFACFYRFPCLIFSRYQNSRAKFRAHAFSSYNEGLGSCWIYWLWPRKVSKLVEVKICLYSKFSASKFLCHFSRLPSIDCQKLSMTSSFQLMFSL
jgi:hypothetical protein